MNTTLLAFEILWKIAGNFIFNPTAIGIILFFALGLSAWNFISKQQA